MPDRELKIQRLFSSVSGACGASGADTGGDGFWGAAALAPPKCSIAAEISQAISPVKRFTNQDTDANLQVYF